MKQPTTSKPPFFKSLGTKFMLFVAIVLTITLGLTTFFLHHSYSLLIERNLRHTGELLGNYIALVSQDALQTSDFIKLEKLAASSAKVEDTVYCVISNKNNTTIAAYINDKYNTSEIPQSEIVEYLAKTKHVIAHVFPIMENGNLLGNVNIGISSTHHKEYLRSKQQSVTLAFLFIILILASGIYIIFRHQALRPIKHLTQGAQRFGKTAFNQPVPRFADDELGDLTESFNRMAQLIESERSKLRKHQANLEKEVEDRTKELLNSNKSLAASEKKSQEQNDFLQNILNALSHPFYVIDAHTYEIVLANKNAGIQVTADKTTCYQLTHKRDTPCDCAEHPCPLEEVRKTHKPVIVEHIHEDILGNKRDVEVHGYPVFDSEGNLQQLIEYSFDITTRKEAEKALRRAKKEAESASLAKGQFVANMSHEIRTPLNAIIGMNRLGMEADPPQEVKKTMKVVQTSAESLLRTLNDILDFSKIEAGQLELENHPFDLRNLLNSVMKTYDNNAIEKGLSLSHIIEPGLHTTYLGDDHRLRQLLNNLIDNAIKFTSTGGIIVEVKHRTQEQEFELLQFNVTDTGPGIPHEMQESIFNSFTQVDSSVSRRHGGSGLGLAICKSLAGMLGGKIWITSTEGQGCTFSFTAMLQQCKKSELLKQQQEDSLHKAKLKNMRILVVEDNQFNLDLVRMVLEKNNHQVTAAENGIAALKQLSTSVFDFILMDVQMPEMDGIMASELIRLCEEGRMTEEEQYKDILIPLQDKIEGGHIPIIAMTAHAMSGDREKCLNAGMDEYVTKPFRPEDVFAALNRVESKKNELSNSKNNKATKKFHHKTIQPLLLSEVQENLANVYALSSDTIDYMLKGLKSFLKEEMDKALSAADDHDMTKVSITVHSVKVALRNIGQSQWADFAEQLEKSARNGDQIDYKKTLEALRTGIAILVEE